MTSRAFLLAFPPFSLNLFFYYCFISFTATGKLGSGPLFRRDVDHCSWRLHTLHCAISGPFTPPIGQLQAEKDMILGPSNGIADEPRYLCHNLPL